MKQSKTNSKLFIFLIIALVSGLILVLAFKEGSKNKVDPFWNELDTLLAANGLMPENYIKSNGFIFSDSDLKRHKLITLDKNFNELENLYSKIHKNNTDTLPVYKLVAEPFLPDWESEKLYKYINPLIAKHAITISGVTGAGKSTLVERVSKIIAGNPDRILSLLCVQKMEVELHKEWIGTLTEKGFHKGKLLNFFDECNKNPNKNYVFIIDDVDKIFPETFFGSALWSEMDNPEYKNALDGYGEVTVPKNFYLISVTHTGVSNVIDFNNEHFRRLGERIPMNPDYKEFLLYIKKKQPKLKLSVEHIKKVLYFFSEVNNFISKNYDVGFTLGQWSTINKQLKPEDFEKFINAFVVHVNSFKPAKPLTREHLEDLIEAANNKGIEPKTNFFYNAYLALLSTGLFSEATVAVTFAVLSALFGWIFVRNKRKFIYDLEHDILKLVERYRNFEIDYEAALDAILKHKHNIETLILNRKVNYDETSFLILFINEQLRKIEDINKTNLVSSDFMKTFESYMEDGVLDAREYKTLTQFLDNLRDAMSPQLYYQLKQRIDDQFNKNSD